MISWLAVLFVKFDLQAPPHRTVLTVILVSALPVAGAVFVISDMANPYAGVTRVFQEPPQERLGRAYAELTVDGQSKSWNQGGAFSCMKSKSDTIFSGLEET